MNLTKSTERILTEDGLKHIYKCELKSQPATIQCVAGVLQISLDDASRLLETMANRGLLELNGGAFHLTPAGQEYALQVIRAHRLWERYLAEETGFAEAEWHDRADRYEHDLSPAEIDDLSARLGHPSHDPHGDPIPTSQGEIKPHAGQPLTTMAAGQAGRIVHLEDEPPLVYSQLIAEGLRPGLELRLTERSSQRIRFDTAGESHVLSPLLAGNVSVVLLSEQPAIDSTPNERLTDLAIGQTGRVVSLSPICRGPERRRLMDLGILPGTLITAELKSPGGDPTAYQIRGALIALRAEQANLINITRPEEVTTA